MNFDFRNIPEVFFVFSCEIEFCITHFTKHLLSHDNKKLLRF
jgi:hypothetical protein